METAFNFYSKILVFYENQTRHFSGAFCFSRVNVSQISIIFWACKCSIQVGLFCIAMVDYISYRVVFAINLKSCSLITFARVIVPKKNCTLWTTTTTPVGHCASLGMPMRIAADSAEPPTPTQTQTSLLAIFLWPAKPTKRVTTTNAGIMYMYNPPKLVCVYDNVPIWYYNVCGASLIYCLHCDLGCQRPAAEIINPDMCNLNKSSRRAWGDSIARYSFSYFTYHKYRRR